MRIYLDHNATSPLRGEVMDVMAEVLRTEFGNPSSVYSEGAAARACVEEARSDIAALLATPPATIRLTGGATESNNTVLFGLLRPGDHVVTTQVEHPSVAAPLDELESRGVDVTRVAPDADGFVDAAAIENALRADTKLVSMIWANNETGVLQPVAEVLEVCRGREIALHTDATQAVGKAPVDLSEVPVDYLSCSAHKLGGPKGAGALVVSPSAESVPSFLRGGGQERGLRGGTENVIGIAGFGVACRLAAKQGKRDREAYGRLRDRLWRGLDGTIPGLRRNGLPNQVLLNTLNVEFSGVAGEVLVQALDLEGVSVSAGAACHSGSIDPSKVLMAMGRTPEEARGSLRFSVGGGIDDKQIDRVIALLTELVPRIRSLEAP